MQRVGGNGDFQLRPAAERIIPRDDVIAKFLQPINEV
jgi:hypothetical protein